MANHHHRKPAVSHELALASDLFDKFCGAATLKTILSNYRSLCEILNMKPANFPYFYPKLKSKLCSWRAQALWNKFDKRANHKCYNRGKACPNTRVLIIGAGPCGLRTAIEAQLLGAKVVVIEKRDRISRNNVLHLWPFVIHDLRSLGAKKFFGKFCAGSIDHISIRQLQCILLKVALLLGVEIHEGVSFESLLSPSSHVDERTGWRAKVSPEDHPVTQYEFDVLIGADGKRNTLEGFKRKEFRGKLAIAITANFINYHTEAEARVEEISGVAYIFNQKFFKDLRSATGIDLENIVYYKDDTHYFVMTAKKASLLNKGVILKDYTDTAKLLAIDNISKEALMEYAREAADFSTGYKLPQLQFAVNHYGQPDVAMFDFTSMYAAENASRVIQEKGYKLLMCLVGDSLLEPFWPTGSGCARGFLSSMDACWAVRSWGSTNSVNPLEVLAERESIYRLLNQTTPENLSRDIANYMLDPHTRYTNLNSRAVVPIQVKSLYASDDPAIIEQCLKAPSNVCDYSKKRRRKDTQIHHDVLLSWLKRQVALHSDIHIENTNKSFKDGLALCAIIHRYRPDLIDFQSLDPYEVSENNQLAFDVLEKEYGILPVMTGSEMEKCETPDNLTMLSYLTQVYDVFRGEIPYTHQRRIVLDDEDITNMEPTSSNMQTPYKNSLNKMSQSQKLSLLNRLTASIPRKRYRESRSPIVTSKNNDAQIPRKPKKRKSGSTASSSIEERKNYLLEHLKQDSSRKPNDRVSRDEQHKLVSARKNLLENLKKEPNRKQFERLTREDQQKMIAARLKALENAKKEPERKQNDRMARRDQSISLAARRRFLENYDKKPPVAPNDRAAIRDQQEKLMAAAIVEKVRMLQENQNQECESIPFEDICMFLYREVTPEFKDRVKELEKKLLHADRDHKELQELKKVPVEVNFSGRIKDIETKLKEGNQLQKKPKDLMRAIGKIEKTDWNVNALEKKIEENKYGRGVISGAAKVPKWNRQQFDDKFTAVKKKLIDKDRSPSRQPSMKYADVDNTLRQLEQKLKNGTVLDQGQRGANKVSAMAAHLITMNQPEERSLALSKSASKIFPPSQGGSEMCHFCNKRVYLMERLNAEGRFFHRGCFRCEYCGTALRLGNYNFDREGKYGSRFYCAQHFGYPGVYRKKSRVYDGKGEVQNDGAKESDDLPKTPTSINLNFLSDSTDTPERIEFENLDIDKEESGNVSISEMDEDEWTDHNFGTSANELASSDDVSDISESDDEEEEEDNEEFAQAIDIPETLGNNESLKFTRRFSTSSLPSITVEEVHRRNSHCSPRGASESRMMNNDDSDSSCSKDSARISYHEFDSEESDTATGERKNADVHEVYLKIPSRSRSRSIASDSGSDTEVASDEYSSDNDYGEDVDADDDDDDNDEDESDDSATEISTDSEFERNHSTVIKSEIPDIIISESLPTRKGHFEEVPAILVISKNLPGPEKSTCRPKDEAKIDTYDEIVENKVDRLAFVNPNRGNYLINRTQSTEGVASKISLELKKKYLLGGDNANNRVKKSESTSVLDTKFKSLVDQISEHQKLLNPNIEPSQTMQTFLDTTVKLRNSSVSPTNSMTLLKSKELTGLNDFPHVCNQVQSSNNIAETNKTNVSCASQPETDTSQTTTGTGATVVERAPSPIIETSIVVPEFLKNIEKSKSTPALVASSTSEVSSADEFEENEKSYQTSANNAQIPLPKFEIHNSQGELLPPDVVLDDKYSNVSTKTKQQQHHHEEAIEKDKRTRETCSSKIMAMPNSDHSTEILRLVSTPAELFISNDVKHDNKASYSDKSSPSTPTSLQGDDNTLAVFTETELSDWARDEDDAVSENFDDLILGTPNITYRRHQKPKKRTGRQAATLGKDKDDIRDEYVHVCGKTEKLKPASFALANLNDMDIEFMDTGDDDACDENLDALNPAFLKNSGYIEYVNSEDEVKTPLAEAVNTSYLPFSDYNVLTPRNDSVVTSGVFSFTPPKDTVTAPADPLQPAEEKTPSDDYDKFVHRFQERITPFNNVKDSIDIRKSRKSPKTPPESPIKESPTEAQIKVLDGPLQKLEKLSRERSKQKNLIHEMVMSKLQSEGRSIQDRKAKRSARNSLSPFNLSSHNSLQSQAIEEVRKEEMKLASKDDTDGNKENISDALLIEASTNKKVTNKSVDRMTDKYAESFSLPDIRKALNDAGDQPLNTVLPSPATLEILKSTESIRQQARTRARLMSDSELGLSPEDKLKLLKQKIAARKAVQSAYLDYPKTDEYSSERNLYSNSVLDALNNAMCEDWKDSWDDVALSPRSRAAKDKDRRKSIIQAVSDFFKKSPTKMVSTKESGASGSSNKLKFKISLMGKEKSKSADDVLALFTEQNDSKNVTDEATQQSAYASESKLKHADVEGLAPPRPPEPASYAPSLDKSDENLSTATVESHEETSTLSRCKNLRSSHRKTKRENQKRLRMAQEIQRQLEEIEVKQKELEFKGVNVEKALRNNLNSESEFELMQELLDMIRERNELRKYEQKLLLKAKEIEAEDPYLN